MCFLHFQVLLESHLLDNPAGFSSWIIQLDSYPVGGGVGVLLDYWWILLDFGHRGVRVRLHRGLEEAKRRFSMIQKYNYIHLVCKLIPGID